MLQQPLQHALARARVLAPTSDGIAEHAVHGNEARLREPRLPDEAPHDVRVRERLARPVLTREAVAELRAQLAARHERDGEEGRGACEPREIHGADAVDGPEVGRVEGGDVPPGVEVVNVVLLEVPDVALDDGVALVLVAEADAGGDLVEAGLVPVSSSSLMFVVLNGVAGDR